MPRKRVTLEDLRLTFEGLVGMEGFKSREDLGRGFK